MSADAFFSCLDEARAKARDEGRFGVAEALDDALFMALSAYHDERERPDAADVRSLRA